MKVAVFVADQDTTLEELSAFHDVTGVKVVVNDGIPIIRTRDPVIANMLSTCDNFHQVQ